MNETFEVTLNQFKFRKLQVLLMYRENTLTIPNVGKFQVSHKNEAKPHTKIENSC